MDKIKEEPLDEWEELGLSSLDEVNVEIIKEEPLDNDEKPETSLLEKILLGEPPEKLVNQEGILVDNFKREPVDEWEVTHFNDNKKKPLNERKTAEKLILHDHSYVKKKKIEYKITKIRSQNDNMMSTTNSNLTVKIYADNKTETQKIDSIGYIQPTQTVKIYGGSKIEAQIIDPIGYVQPFFSIIKDSKINSILYVENTNPITLNFDIDMEKTSEMKYADVIKGTLIPMLEKNLPNLKMNVKLLATHKQLSYVTSQVCFRPKFFDLDEKNVSFIVLKLHKSMKDKLTPLFKTSLSPSKEYIYIDISERTKNFGEPIKHVLEILCSNFNPDLINNKPCVFKLRVIPPKYSNHQFLDGVITLLLPILTENFHNNAINIQTSGQYNTEGFFIDILLEITIHKTEKISKHYKKTINLSEVLSGDVYSKLNEVILSIEQDIDDDMKCGKNVALELNIIPQQRSPKNYLDTLNGYLTQIINTKFLKGFRLKIISRKNYNGDVLIAVTLLVTFVPITVFKGPHRMNFVIDLNKDILKNITHELISPIAPQVYTHFLETGGTPVSLHFDIIQPKGNLINCFESYFNELQSELIPDLKYLFPHTFINLEMTSFHENPSDISVVAVIKLIRKIGNFGQETINISLPVMGITYSNSFHQILPQLKKNIQLRLLLEKSVVLVFNFFPPKNSRQDYLDKFMDEFVFIFTDYFRDNDIKIDNEVRMNSRGFLSKIILTVIVEAQFKYDNDIQSPTTGVTLDVDISNLWDVERVDELITQVKDALSEHLSSEHLTSKLKIENLIHVNELIS